MNAQLKETESTEIDLLPANALANPAELFTRERLDDVIERIRSAVKIVPDVTTEEGRKAIASTAYKAARSKTAIDAAGKGLVEGWKAQAKVIDGLRKYAWDSLERIQAEARAPLTEWETEQKRIEAEAVEAARLRREAEEAERVAELARREAELAEREAKLAAAEKAEADWLATIERDRLQAERDEAIRAEAERAAAAAVDKARQDAVDAEARREREAEAAKQAAHDAAIKAERDQAEAVRTTEERIQREREIAESVAQRRRAEQEAEEARKAANLQHRAAINRKAVAALVTGGLSESEARNVITLIATGKIPAVSIAY